MNIKIKPLQKKDYSKAISYAITGMHFDCYLDNPFLLKLYGRYFWYLELGRATQVIAAYNGDNLVGILLASMAAEKKAKPSMLQNAYVKVFDFIQRTFYKDGVGSYDEANAEMFKAFSASHKPDGEICFLAADPNSKIKGVGTLLLQELEKREAGKRIYLYTDNNCTYQFYENRGFERVGEKQISLSFSEKDNVPLSCYLYTKVCGKDGTVNDK